MKPAALTAVGRLVGRQVGSPRLIALAFFAHTSPRDPSSLLTQLRRGRVHSCHPSTPYRATPRQGGGFIVCEPQLADIDRTECGYRPARGWISLAKPKQSQDSVGWSSKARISLKPTPLSPCEVSQQKTSRSKLLRETSLCSVKLWASPAAKLHSLPLVQRKVQSTAHGVGNR